MIELEDHQGVLDQHRQMIEKNKRASYLTLPAEDFIEAVDDYGKYVSASRWFTS